MLNFAIGESWVQRFIHRHPDLETAYSHTIQVAHTKEVTNDALDQWFDELKRTIEEKNIRIEDMYNMDETEFSIGSVQDSPVIVSKTSKTLGSSRPTGVGECVGMYLHGWGI